MVDQGEILLYAVKISLSFIDGYTILAFQRLIC